jgi:hypothetical protein
MIKRIPSNKGTVNFERDGVDLGMKLYIRTLKHAAKAHGVHWHDEMVWHINHHLNMIKQSPLSGRESIGIEIVK